MIQPGRRPEKQKRWQGGRSDRRHRPARDGCMAAARCWSSAKNPPGNKS